MLARNISAEVVLFRFSFLSIMFVAFSRFGFVFKVVVVFLELTLMQKVFFSVSFDAIVFRISSCSAFSSFVLSIQSLWSILSCFSLMVLSQNITIWFINAKENPFRLENDLSVPGRNFQLLVQERVVHLSEKFYFWCIRKGNRFVKHTVSISSVWLLIHLCCAFDPMLEKLLKNLDFKCFINCFISFTVWTSKLCWAMKKDMLLFE